MKPRLLDLFCGAGGAAMGYHRAGFDVVGVDIEPQPRYPFLFIRHDAMTYLLDGHGELPGFDAIHASPPCQAFTQASAKHRGRGGVADERPDLLTPTLAILRTWSRVPWVVENVVGARRVMKTSLRLHGGMFGLGTHRPRLFESNVLLLAPQAQKGPQGLGIYGRSPDGRTLNAASGQRAARSLKEGSAAMGIDWMTWDELREAIPPAYTEFIGKQLIRAVEQRKVA